MNDQITDCLQYWYSIFSAPAVHADAYEHLQAAQNSAR